MKETHTKRGLTGASLTFFRVLTMLVLLMSVLPAPAIMAEDGGSTPVPTENPVPAPADMPDQGPPLPSSADAAIALLSVDDAAGIVLADAPSPTGATIASDKPDYAPGETVTLIGANWASGEVVHIFVNDDAGQTWSLNSGQDGAAPDPVADTSGALTYQFQLPNWFVAIYSVVATGPTSGVATTTFTDAPAAVNLDQCRNGSAASPNDCKDFGGNSGWVNGNVGASQAHMLEGYSTPFRAVMTNLPAGTSITLVIGYDIRNSGANAYDYLTQYQRLDPHAYFGHPAETVFPTDGVTGFSATTSTFPIPAPSSAGSPVAGQPTASFNSLPASERVMTLFGGTISAMAYVSQGSLTASQSETQLSVTFTVDNPTAVLAWGGHISQCSVWGTTNGTCNSAGGISGSPYHMRLISWGPNLPNLGNTDRSMAASVVVQPGNLTLAKSLTGGPNGYTGPFTINYSCTDGTSGSVSVNAGSSQTINGIPSGSVCTISETPPTPPTGYTFGTPTFSPSNTVTIGQGTTVTVTTNNTLTRLAQDLTVTKTATASFSRLYKWLIDKSVDKTTISIAEGGTATFNYSVKVTPDGYTDSAWTVGGKITVANPNGFAISGVNVADAIDNGGSCTVTGGTNVTVPANGNVVLDYSCTYAAAPSPAAGTNTATATWDKATYGTPNGSASGTAGVDFSKVTPSETNKTITVVDDKTDPAHPVTLGTWNWADGEHSFTYSLNKQGVAGTCTDYTNTAKINETVQSDTQKVTVCVGKDLTVSKTAAGTYNRTYQWEISKDVDQTLVKIAEGGSYTFHYTVNVEQTGISESGWTLSGKITVNNPNDWEAITVNVTDAVDNGGTCVVTGGTGVSIPASGSKTFDYTCSYASEPTNYSGTNTATATWDKAAAFTPDGSASGSAAFTLSQAGSTNKTVHVTDSYGGNLGTVTATDSEPFAKGTFTYDRTESGVAGKCTSYNNTAKITETDQTTSKTVTLCVGKDLTISKTASGTFDRTYLWKISKDVNQTLVKIADGGSYTFQYTVDVEQTGVSESGWTLSGKITVNNPNDWEAITVDVTDVVDNGGTCTVSGGTGVSIPANGSKTFDYTCSYASQPAYSGTNTATVTWDKAVAYTPNGSASGSAAFTLSQVGATNKTVHVTDSYKGDLDTVTATDSEPFTTKQFTYTRTESGVAGTCTKYDNTAKITETDQSASKEVTLCVGKDLTLTKTAAGTYGRTYLWKISKDVNQTLVKIAEGGSYTFQYTVVAEQTGISDEGWTLSGKITVNNPNDWEAITVDVTDAVDNGGTCVVTGGMGVSIPAGGSKTFDYTCSYASRPAYSGTNTATATWDKAAAFTPNGSASGSAPFTLSQVGATNKTVHVTDSYGGDLGTVTANDAAPFAKVTFTYDRTESGVAGKCTSYDNTATITETGASASKTVTLCVAQNLTVTKTAVPSFTRTWDWTITKEADATYNLFAGGSVTHGYKVTVTPNSTDSAWKVVGTITIHNPNSWEAIVADVSDAVDNGGTCTLDDATQATVTVPAGGSVDVDYTCTWASMPTKTDYTGTNTATVTWNKATYFTPDGTASGTKGFQFTNPTEINPTITVDDNNLTGENWSADRAYAEWTYTKDFTCSSDPADYVGDGKYDYFLTNTATIKETTGDSDSATVTVNCYAPVVSKTAAGTYDERHEWTVEKTVNPVSQSAFAGDTVSYEWKVVVTEQTTEENFKVAGEITVQNPAPMAMAVDLADSLGGGTAGVIGTCTNGTYASGKLTIPANTTATCAYTAGPGGRTDTVNNATATLNGIDFSASATFGWTANVIRASVSLDDDQNPAFPKTLTDGDTFTYTEQYTCSTDKAAYDATTHKYTFGESNTATVKDGETTLDSSTVSTSVNCYVPTISKDANGTYDEVHDWDVYKSVNPTSQNAFAGQMVNFSWTVRVDETTHGENYNVSGGITVVNPNPEDALTVSLSDALNDGSVATIGPCTGGTWSSPNLTVPAGGTATCDYTVTPKGDMAAFNAALPAQVTMKVSYPYAGGPSYFPVTTISGDGALNGTYEGWCADIDHTIVENTEYTSNVYSSYESLPAGIIEKAYNLDLVNWIINQDFVGKSAGGTLGSYTYGDVQRAIWELIEDNPTASTNGLGSWSQTRVNQIKAAATANGEGFTPTCGDFVAVILQPVGGQQLITIAQVTFASLGIDCADSNAVTAVLNGVEFPASAEILWTVNKINETATLDDDQKLDWPTTVSADTTFTYQDPQGYTCSTTPGYYSNGKYTYTEPNTALLTFSTGSDSAIASTAVNCYAPVVSKTAATEWRKKYDWTITKTADPTSHTGFAGDSFTSAYDVFVDQTITDYGFKATGTIDVKNPNGSPGNMTVNVADMVSGGFAATVDCDPATAGNQTSVVVAANTTKTCTYTVSLPDNTSRVNTATGTFNSIGFPATANVTFGAPIIEGYPTINVTDNVQGALGSASGDYTFEYNRTFTCSSNASDYTNYADSDTYPNTATIVETGQSNGASVKVNCYWPQIDITKSGDELSKITDKVYYDITAYNNTPADLGLRALSCTISDPKIGFSKTVELVSGAKDENLDIEFTIPQTNEDPFKNTASVTCSPLNSTFSVSDSAEWSTNLFQPAVEIIKTGPLYATSGDVITYKFTINNLSSSDSPKLMLDSISDDVLGDLKTAALAAGCDNLVYNGTCTFTVNYTVPDAGLQAYSKTNVVTVHYKPAGFPNDVKDDDDHTVIVAPKSQLTDTSFCPLPNNQFRLLYRMYAAPNTYLLNSSNPGQWYFNAFYYGAPGSNFTMSIQVPYPFMTQEGAGNPIQVHDGTGLTSSGCYIPTPSLPGFTITTQAMSPVSSAGNQIITPEDYTTKQLGQYTTVTISGKVPATGLAYVTIHLDYGLKKTADWKPTGGSTNNPVNGTSYPDVWRSPWAPGAVTIHGYEVYNFARTVGSDTSTSTPSSYNEIKKFAGFLGFVNDKEGDPMANVKVTIYDPKNALLTTQYTDADGYYMYLYKHTAKSATYTVKLPAYNKSTAITVKANGFAPVDFVVP